MGEDKNVEVAGVKLRSDFRAWAEIDENGTPCSPWGILAIELLKASGLDQDDCRDRVILHHLKQGEIAPLACLFQNRIVPSPEVLYYIGVMMAPEEAPADFVEKHVPYGLIISKIADAYAKRAYSKTGRKNPILSTRDDLIAENVEDRLHTGMLKKSAIGEVAEGQTLSG